MEFRNFVFAVLFIAMVLMFGCVDVGEAWSSKKECYEHCFRECMGGGPLAAVSFPAVCVEKCQVACH